MSHTATSWARVLERIVKAQADIAAVLPDDRAIMRLVALYAMDLTRATGASIATQEGENVCFRMNEGSTTAWEETRLPLASTLSGKCLQTGQMYQVQDLDNFPPSEGTVERAASIRSFLAVPLHHKGGVIAALSVASPLPQAFGDSEIPVLQLLVGLAGDALAHSEAFHDLKIDKEDAEHARAETAEFAGMIAHELGSPIAAIRHAADLLATAPLDPQQERARSLIETESKALLMLVGDLRATASMERGNFDLHPRSVILGPLLSQAGDFAQTLPGNHVVCVEVAPEIEVIADPGRIAQVLRNLIANAAKYARAGSPIIVRSSVDQDRAWIEVIDKGPGIAPGDLTHIFANFGRGRQATSQRIPGLGLGLHLSKRIVEAHGGELTVQSTPGEGSTFTFSLKIDS